MPNSGSSLIDAINAAYPAMAQLYASDWYVSESANEGYYVMSGCAITASGTAGKIDMSAGTIYAGTTEVNITAVTAFATTITSIADATNPKWVAVEVEPTTPTAAVNFNQGTAAANPIKPTPTTARVVVAWLYVPATATLVDALTSTANGKAKIIDARQLVATRSQRVLANMVTQATLTANTSPWTVGGTTAATWLDATVSLPANSLNVKDTLHIRGSGAYLNNVANSTFVMDVRVGSVLVSFTTESLTTNASSRRWDLDMTLTVVAIGASANMSAEGFFLVSPASASTAAPVGALGGGANGSLVTMGQNLSSTFDSTAAQTFDSKITLGTSSTGATFLPRHFTLLKTQGL